MRSTKKQGAFACRISCCKTNYVLPFWQDLLASQHVQSQLRCSTAVFCPNHGARGATEALSWQNSLATKRPCTHAPLQSLPCRYYLPPPAASAGVSCRLGGCQHLTGSQSRDTGKNPLLEILPVLLILWSNPGVSPTLSSPLTK